MKVGILSLNSGYNFGGSLQSYALKNVLEGLGHDVQVIDYHPVDLKLKKFWRGWGLKGPHLGENVSRRLSELRHLGPYRVKYDGFKTKHFNPTDRCQSSDEVNEVFSTFEAIVVGSDQVWNLTWHDDPVFYFAEPINFEGCKISYASCCGRNSDRNDDWISVALSEFKAISVRNLFTLSWVEKMNLPVGIEPEKVADPTLLYDFEEIDKIGMGGDYIFVYLLSEASDEFHRKIIHEIRNRYSAKSLKVILAMPTGIKITKYSWADEVLWMLDPFEWVSWLAGAAHVYTDSFHAVIFSLKNRIPVLAYYTEAIRAPRLIELGEDFGIEAAVISIDSDSISTAVGHEFNWGVIRARIEKTRGDSLRFLEEAL